jgi:hypothetical protein
MVSRVASVLVIIVQRSLVTCAFVSLTGSRGALGIAVHIALWLTDRNSHHADNMEVMSRHGIRENTHVLSEAEMGGWPIQRAFC